MLASLERSVEPEWLDELPTNDPRAVQSRQDLRRINAWMGNARIMRCCLEGAFASSAPRSLVEIGAGDGTFLLKVARKLHRVWPSVNVMLVDRQDVILTETIRQFEAFGWSAEKRAVDVFDWLETTSSPAADVMVANLFLHHFKEEELRRLLAAASQQASVVAAVEPRRSRASLVAGGLLWAIGCNDVTRHDALVSIRAGFAGQEISRLWPTDPGWKLIESAVNWSSHLFVARREPAAKNPASGKAGC